MKQCTLCKQLKPIIEFSWRSKSKQVKHERCKVCVRSLSQKHYQSNKPSYYKRRQLQLKEIQEFVKRFKQANSCIICDENAPECLDFHHLDPKQKDIEVSNITTSLRKLRKEIEKCVLVCANCHKKIHTGRIALVTPQSSKLVKE